MMGADPAPFVGLCQDIEEMTNWWIYVLCEVDGKMVSVMNCVLIFPHHILFVLNR